MKEICYLTLELGSTSLGYPQIGLATLGEALGYHHRLVLRVLSGLSAKKYPTVSQVLQECIRAREASPRENTTIY